MNRLAFTGLLDTLVLLDRQVDRYEQALPPNDYPARAAVTVLGRLAQQALCEARDLAAALDEADHFSRSAGQPPFSRREAEVIALAAQGMTNKEIAYRLRLSERTVQFHMNSIFNKTATNSRTEAVALALKNRWLP